MELKEFQKLPIGKIFYYISGCGDDFEVKINKNETMVIESLEGISYEKQIFNYKKYKSSLSNIKTVPKWIQDLYYPLDKKLKKMKIRCARCMGSGFLGCISKKTCPRCRGKGAITQL